MRNVRVVEKKKPIKTCNVEFYLREPGYYALERRFTCNCGGDLNITRKRSDRDEYVCAKCRTLWVCNYQTKEITAEGKVARAIKQPSPKSMGKGISYV